MVPKLLIRSALVIPTPLSIIARVRSSLLGMIWIFMSLPESSLPGSVRDSYLILSRASEELEIFAGIEFAGFCEGFISDFVEGVRGIGDQLSEENLFVGVESVDDEGHELSDLSLEGKGFHFFCHLAWF